MEPPMGFIVISSTFLLRDLLRYASCLPHGLHLFLDVRSILVRRQVSRRRIEHVKQEPDLTAKVQKEWCEPSGAVLGTSKDPQDKR